MQHCKDDNTPDAEKCPVPAGGCKYASFTKSTGWCHLADETCDLYESVDDYIIIDTDTADDSSGKQMTSFVNGPLHARTSPLKWVGAVHQETESVVHTAQYTDKGSFTYYVIIISVFLTPLSLSNVIMTLPTIFSRIDYLYYVITAQPPPKPIKYFLIYFKNW